VTTDAEVIIDDVPVQEAVLRDDLDPAGASRVDIGSIRFFVIRRGDQHAVRVRDRNHPARESFTGRRWFAVDPRCRVIGVFTPHAEPRTLEIVNSVGMLAPMKNPGAVEFDLIAQRVRLEALYAGDDELWFIFRDSHPLTYPGGRFLYAPLSPGGEVTLDFNKAYNPPCVFMSFATCPLAPPENHLPFPVEAGEIAAQE
jgi:uncharacterized protein (DUF1684 family)